MHFYGLVICASTSTNEDKMMKRLIVIVSMLVMVSGCATFKQSLHNYETGETVSCDHFGYGIIGTPMAKAAQEACEDYWQERGFETCDECPPGPTPRGKPEYRVEKKKDRPRSDCLGDTLDCLNR